MILLALFLLTNDSPQEPLVTTTNHSFHINLAWDAGTTNDYVVHVIDPTRSIRLLGTTNTTISVSNLWHSNSYVIYVENAWGASNATNWPPTINTFVTFGNILNGTNYSGQSPLTLTNPSTSPNFWQSTVRLTNDAWIYRGLEQPD